VLFLYIAMIADLLRKSYKFIEAASDGDDAMAKNVQDTQFAHLMAVVRRTTVSTDESTSALIELKRASFSSDRCSALHSAIIESTDAARSMGSKKTFSTSVAQTHMLLYNYLPMSLWDALKDDSISLDEKCEKLTDFMHSIGLLHPSQTPTQVGACAIIVATDGRTHSPIAVYNALDTMRKQLSFKRKFRCDTAVSLNAYPVKVEDYVTVAPNAYSPADPPVACQISALAIRNTLRIVACRKSNALVRDHVQPQAAPVGMGRLQMQGLPPNMYGRFGAAAYNPMMQWMPNQFDAPVRRVNSKRPVSMLANGVNEAVHADDVPHGLAIEDRGPPAEPPLVPRATDELGDGDDADGLDAMLVGLGHVGSSSKGKNTGKSKRKSKRKNKMAKKPANGDVHKKLAGHGGARKKFASHVKTKLRGGWLLLVVQRGGAARSDATYNLYLRSPAHEITFPYRSLLRTCTCLFSLGRRLAGLNQL